MALMAPGTLKSLVVCGLPIESCAIQCKAPREWNEEINEFGSSFRSEAPSEVDQRTEVDFGEGEMPARLQRIFQDPSEPIYTEPSLFERSRSLRSVAASDFGRVLRISEQPASETETERAVL